MNEQYEIVVRNDAILGEGPAWDERTQSLLWVDIVGQNVCIYDTNTGSNTKIHIGQFVGSIVPRSTGGYAVATNDGIIALSDDGKIGDILVPFAISDQEQINDGKCDKSGRYWTGTMAHDRTSPVCSLYRANVDNTLHQVLSHVIVSNGMAWNAANNKMYYIDTKTKYVDLFDFNSNDGTLSNRHHLIGYQQEHGLPDGMTIDADDFLWIAMWGGWAINRYTPSGKLDCTIKLPVEKITSCCFGGKNLTDLYVTSSKHGLTEKQLLDQPLAGSLFRIKTGVKGTNTMPYKG